MTERKFAHNADGEVERYCHNDVAAGGNEPALLRAVQRARGVKSGNDNENDDNEQVGRIIKDVCFFEFESFVSHNVLLILFPERSCPKVPRDEQEVRL